MSAIVEGKRKIILAGTASLVEEGRELAWVQPHITRQPDLKWITGNYVQADVANSNGHIFPLEDLQQSIKSIPNKALNLIHVPHRIVGHFVAAEMVSPGAESADDGIITPVVEALATFYSYYFPEILPSMEMAHKDGQLFYSMESVPSQVTCKGKGLYEGCGRTFDYDGRTSETYCDHLNEICARKVLHKPHFTAGALIIPPVKPGWKRAEIKEISALLSEESDAAEQTYKEVADMTPHLGPRSWETIMTFLLKAAQ